MSSKVRSIIMRAMFEPDFHNLLTANPDEALKPYELSPTETDVLKNPGPALYKLIQPSTDITDITHGALLADAPPPAPSVIVAVIVVVAITVFVAAATSDVPKTLDARYSTLINAIQQSTGAARIDLIKTLVNELTKNH